MENLFDMLIALKPLAALVGEQRLPAVLRELADMFDAVNSIRSVLTHDEQALVAANNVIGAIKSVRERTHVGLKEAKDLVDAYRATKGGVRG